MPPWGSPLLETDRDTIQVHTPLRNRDPKEVEALLLHPDKQRAPLIQDLRREIGLPAYEDDNYAKALDALLAAGELVPYVEGEGTVFEHTRPGRSQGQLFRHAGQLAPQSQSMVRDEVGSEARSQHAQGPEPDARTGSFRSGLLAGTLPLPPGSLSESSVRAFNRSQTISSKQGARSRGSGPPRVRGPEGGDRVAGYPRRTSASERAQSDLGGSTLSTRNLSAFNPSTYQQSERASQDAVESQSIEIGSIRTLLSQTGSASRRPQVNPAPTPGGGGQIPSRNQMAGADGASGLPPRASLPVAEDNPPVRDASHGAAANNSTLTGQFMSMMRRMSGGQASTSHPSQAGRLLPLHIQSSGSIRENPVYEEEAIALSATGTDFVTVTSHLTSEGSPAPSSVRPNTGGPGSVGAAAAAQTPSLAGSAASSFGFAKLGSGFYANLDPGSRQHLAKYLDTAEPAPGRGPDAVEDPKIGEGQEAVHSSGKSESGDVSETSEGSRKSKASSKSEGSRKDKGSNKGDGSGGGGRRPEGGRPPGGGGPPGGGRSQGGGGSRAGSGTHGGGGTQGRGGNQGQVGEQRRGGSQAGSQLGSQVERGSQPAGEIRGNSPGSERSRRKGQATRPAVTATADWHRTRSSSPVYVAEQTRTQEEVIRANGRGETFPRTRTATGPISSMTSPERQSRSPSRPRPAHPVAVDLATSVAPERRRRGQD